MEFNNINVMCWKGFVCKSVSAGGSANTLTRVKTDSGDRLQQVKGSDEHVSSSELIVIYSTRGPRHRAVTKQLHAQLGAGQEVTFRRVISSSQCVKRESKKPPLLLTLDPCG